MIVGSHSQSTLDEPKEVNGTLIVQAGKEGYYVGTAALILNKETIEAKSGRIDTMTFDMPDDDRVMEMIHEYESKTGRINQELFARRIQKNGTNLDFIPSERFKLEAVELSMYSTLEKTIILKSVDLFKSIPAENLSRVAQITEEVQYDANEPIFAEGDYGDSLFIVVNGNVKIHKGEQELAMLGKGTCLGEMALLDDEPRSADATVTEDSVLFRIEQEGFYEVMGSQSDIMEGIIKLLTGRLRVANDKLMAK